VGAHDVVVIGTGPGGYVCAIRAAQLGLDVAVVEKRATHGGTCLNVGCIPSKALLHASELFQEAGHGFKAFGIDVDPRLNLGQMMRHRQETVDANVGGVDYLFKKNKITTYHGAGRITSPGSIEVTSNGRSTMTTVEAKAIVIATGSDVAQLPGVEIDEDTVLSSTGALELGEVPGKLVVIGAGIIGLELGSVWRRLGSEVVFVEFLDRVLPGMDGEVAKQFQRMLGKQGFTFKLSTKVTGVETTRTGAIVTVEPVAGGASEQLECDKVLVATGRRPFTEGLGLEEVGVTLEKGRVVIDDAFRTSVPGIYAIGDVVRGPMLAHKAEDEGVACAEIIAGQHGHVNYEVIPGVVYTYPEIAAVGRTEEELKSEGITYKVGKFPFTANGRARANRTTEGFVKVLADAATDRVLGVHIVGAGAGEMIHEAAVLMEFGGSSEDLARTCHAHPTMSEAVKEAALAVEGRAIHM
jgi:dihydrolipoamide dehydrogenase